MNSLSRLKRWWLSGLASVGILTPVLALVIWAAWSDQSSAQGGNRSDVEFNHASTGFQLTGGHAQVACERCHVQGVFRGTPMQCFQCHSPGGRVFSTFKPANHLPTTVNCNSCHRTTNWVPAYFTHNGVAPGTCAKCHDNSVRSGKPPTHMPTMLACDACHQGTTMWTEVTFTHAGVVPGTCATCHNGVQATGKPTTHIVTSLSCDSCHRAGTRWSIARNSYDHTGITSGCAGCHNGVQALGKPVNHIPVSSGCETCHSTWRFGAGAMNHSGITTGCATCHNGSTYAGVKPVAKPANHIPTSSACETCHQSTVTFTGTLMNHSGIASGCSACHGTGKTFVGGIVTKPATHFPTTQSDCTGCHIVPAAPGTGSFAGGIFSHSAAGIVIGGGKCATCHSGAYVGVVGKPATHIITSSSCDSCHKDAGFTSFAGAAPIPDHSSFTSSTTCVSAGCHDGRTAVGKPSNHIPTTLTTCGSCHKWPTAASSFAGTPMNHTVVSGTACATCHATGLAFFGVTMVTKPANHFPVTGDCGVCHKSTLTGGFANTAFSHSAAGITIGSGKCATCHNGSYAGVIGKPATHIITSSPCDTCHKDVSFTSWAGAAADHSTVTTATTCVSAGCHDGKTAVGKPASHIPTTLTTCGSCHKWPTAASSFAGTPMNHAAVSATTCTTCHATGMTFYGVTMVTKPTNHLPTTSDCKKCHSTVSFSGTVMNHSGITTNCATCHSGGTYAGVTPVAKPANHFPTANPCELCHKSTAVPGGFSQFTMNHLGITTGCMTCHGGVGGAWPWAGAVPGIETKPTNHLPTTYSCELCHKSTSLWSGGKMDHLGITTGCMTCHGSAAPITFAGVTPLAQPATNHYLLGSAIACESCHHSTSTFTVASMNHAAIPAITGKCASCHERGLKWVGGIVTRPTDHAGKEGPPNSCDNVGCHRGYSSFNK